MKIAVGADHVGFPLKQAVIAQLVENGVDVVDVGTYDPEKPVDYPDYAFQVDKLVATHSCDRGILICGTGLGMSIAANKFPGVRAALCDDTFSARLSRAHNDANVLCMGVNVVTPARAEWIVKVWLETPFDHGRHDARLSKLDQAFGDRKFALEGLSSSLHLSWDRFAVALSPRLTVFGPVLFAGRFLEGLQTAAQVGFQKVEISLRHPDDFPNNELDQILSQNGLGLSAIATGQSCLHDDLCLCSPSSDLCQMTVDTLKSYMHIGKRLGAVVIIGGIRGRLTGSEKEMNEQRRRAITAIRDCAAYARELSVPLVLECINRYETNFICSVDEGLAALDEIGDPDLKLLLDTFHMNIEEPDIADSVRKVAGRLGYVHFSDSNRQAPGCGHIDFIRVLDALESIGYTGTISTEVLPIPDDPTALSNVAVFFHSLITTQPAM